MGFNQLYDICCVCYGAKRYGLNFKPFYCLLQIQSELSRIIDAENVSGVEDLLKKALKVLHGGKT